jgi:hypothetical protein
MRPTDFYLSLLGFRKSDWREGRSMFLRCSPEHHTVNFFKGEARLAHLAFEVKDFPELVRASDLLVRNGLPQLQLSNWAVEVLTRTKMSLDFT